MYPHVFTLKEAEIQLTKDSDFAPVAVMTNPLTRRRNVFPTMFDFSATQVSDLRSEEGFRAQTRAALLVRTVKFYSCKLHTDRNCWE